VTIIVLFLAFDVAVHDHAAICTEDFALFEAHSADCKEGLHIFSRRNFVGHEIHVVSSVWICTQSHQELSYILGSSHCCEMQRCITLFIGNVWLRTIL